MIGTITSLIILQSLAQTEVVTAQSSGGIFTARQGTVQLEVPQGAVSAPTPIFFQHCSFLPEPLSYMVGSGISIGRPSLSFSSPAVLRLSYEEANVPHGASESALRIYRILNHRWTLVGGAVDVNANVVSASIPGAGTYGIAAGPAVLVENRLFMSWGDTEAENATIFRGSIPDVGQPQAPFEVAAVSHDKLPGQSIAFSPQYNAAVVLKPSGGRAVRFYLENLDRTFPLKLNSLPFQRVNRFAVSPDGRNVAVLGQYNGSKGVFVFSTAGGEPRLLHALDDPRGALAWNPAGDRLAHPSVTPGIIAGQEVPRYQVRTTRVSDGVQLSLLNIPYIRVGNSWASGFARNLAWHPGGAGFMFYTSIGLYTWDSTGLRPRGYPLNATDLGILAFSPDGTRALVSDGEDALTLDPSTWTVTNSFQWVVIGVPDEAGDLAIAWR